MNETMLNYKNMVPFLANMIGPNYEIALHDATIEGAPIIAIANNHISDRAKGDLATISVLEEIEKRTYEDKNYISNQDAISVDGKKLRSSIFFIKDQHFNLIGLLSMSFDDSQFVDLAKQLLELVHPDETLVKRTTNSKEDKSEMTMNQLINKSIIEYLENKNLLTISHNKEDYENITQNLSIEDRENIIELLYSKKIFELKGAINEISEVLSISPPSVYRYLSKVKAKQ